MQKELKEEIRKEKEQYKNKIESHFIFNNMRSMWSGMKLMSRYVNGNTQKIASVNTAGEVNELNQFFNRFDCHDFSQKRRMIHDILNRAFAEEDDFQRLNTSEAEVRRAFQHVNPNKATGPDNIAPRVLKACAEQLAYIFCIIFNACFSTNTVPTTWKTACTVPIPKLSVISSMNDLRPVALTSAVMKVCEQVVLCKLEKLVKDYIDPLQFAYRKNRSTDDTVLYSLENIYSHLENKTKTTTRSTVRLMFFDLSSHIYLFKTFKHETTVIRYFMDL